MALRGRLRNLELEIYPDDSESDERVFSQKGYVL